MIFGSRIGFWRVFFCFWKLEAFRVWIVCVVGFYSFLIACLLEFAAKSEGMMFLAANWSLICIKLYLFLWYDVALVHFVCCLYFVLRFMQKKGGWYTWMLGETYTTGLQRRKIEVANRQNFFVGRKILKTIFFFYHRETLEFVKRLWLGRPNLLGVFKKKNKNFQSYDSLILLF